MSAHERLLVKIKSLLFAAVRVETWHTAEATTWDGVDAVTAETEDMIWISMQIVTRRPRVLRTPLAPNIV